MNECRNKFSIYCDAIGSYVSQSECEKCLLKKDCIKIKLSPLYRRHFKIIINSLNE